MKAIIFTTVSALCLMLFCAPAQAQILKRVKERVEQTTNDRIVNKAGNVTDKTLEKAEESARKNPKEKEDKSDKGIIILTGKEGEEKSAQQSIPTLETFKNYDFVAGDKVLFFYDMMDEAVNEIPGRLLLNDGSAEIQNYKGEKVLVVPTGGVLMKPLIKSDSYLPEQFTLEFDILSNGGMQTTIDHSEIVLYFREKGAHEGSATAPFKINLWGVSGDNPSFMMGMYSESKGSLGGTSKQFPDVAINPTQNNWRHVSVYVNKNIGKLYMDQHRLAVVNQIEPGMPATLTIAVDNDKHPVLFKNFRLAAGGTDSYKKVMADGKFIAYGIQFDVNKATLRPESAGTINEFVKMMKENSDLKFEIGGHTDTDGTVERNQFLSAERANAVKAQMVSMGIDAARLTTKGFGSSKPLEQNDSAENKAKNRRVEFVVIK